MENGWFYEKGESFPGQTFGLKVKEVLFEGKSKFQDVLVFESEQYGKVLVLDGIIQCTQRDEFAYQEMITFLALNSHPNPKKVLIVGGGDGGVAREAAKHPDVESIDLCEVDQLVIDVSKKYLAHMACGLSHPNVTVHVDDGFEFMKRHKNEYDVIIADTSDPTGPALKLFGSPFYQLMKEALKEDGLLTAQGECLWLDFEFIKQVLGFCSSLFPVTSYAISSVPTYTTGTLGYFLCSKNPKTRFEEPLRKFTQEEHEELNLRYYNEKVHRSSFTLPESFRKILEDCITGAKESKS